MSGLKIHSNNKPKTFKLMVLGQQSVGKSGNFDNLVNKHFMCLKC